MAKQTRDQLKSYFQDGKTPDQDDFADLIDSQLNLEDTGTQIIAGTISASGINAGLSLEALSLRSIAVQSFTGSNEFGSQSAALSSGVTSHSFFGPIYQSSSGADSASYFLTPVNFGVTESPMKNGGIFIQKELGLGAEGALQNQLSQSISASLLITGGLSHLAFDSNEIDQWGDNLYIKAYSTEADKGNIIFQTGEADTSFDTRMIIKKDGTVDVKDILSIDDTPLLHLKNNNTTRGPFNPIIAAIQNSGKCLNLDTDFWDGSNNVNLYDNRSGGHVTKTRMLWTSESASAFNSDWGEKTTTVVSTDSVYYKGWSSSSILDAVAGTNVTHNDFSLGVPNSSGYVIEIKYDGTANNANDVYPGLGGFYQHYQNPQLGGVLNQMNHTYVQVFKACLTSSHEFITNENPQGNNNTTYWLTTNKGTDKWEWYARVNHVGDELGVNNDGTIEPIRSAGHVYVKNIEGSIDYNTPVTFYLASCTVYDMTEADAFTHRRIGIGTINPTNPLHVDENSSVGGIGSQNYDNAPVKIKDSNCTMYIGGDSINMDCGSYINTNGPNDLFFGTNDTERLRIESSGNIVLHQGNGITFVNPTSAEQTIEFNTDRLRFWAGGGERLTILSSSGHVGINTSNPNSILEVAGQDPILTIRDTETTSTSATPTLRLAETHANNVSVDNHYDLKMSNNKFVIHDNWRPGADGSTGNRFIINNVGEIGIGTDPQAGYKLKVDGTVKATSLEGAASFDEIFIGDDYEAKFGQTQNNPGLKIYHRTNDDVSYFLHYGDGSTGDLIIRNNNANGKIYLQTGGVDNYFLLGGDKITAYKDLLIKDNKRLYLGTNEDLTIYHNAPTNDNWIFSVPNLYINAPQTTLAVNDEDYIIFGGSTISFSKPIELPNISEVSAGAYSHNVVVDSSGNLKKTSSPNGVPLGTIVMWPNANPPEGWVFCNSNNAGAHSSGVTIPDLTSLFIKASNSDGSNIGSTGGESSTTLTAAHIPYHSIDIPATTNLNGSVIRISETFNNNATPTNENGGRMWRTTGQNAGGTPEHTDTGNTGQLNYNFNHGHTFSFGQSSPTAIDTVPPYTTLAHIIFVG